MIFSSTLTTCCPPKCPPLNSYLLESYIESGQVDSIFEDPHMYVCVYTHAHMKGYRFLPSTCPLRYKSLSNKLLRVDAINLGGQPPLFFDSHLRGK